MNGRLRKSKGCYQSVPAHVLSLRPRVSPSLDQPGDLMPIESFPSADQQPETKSHGLHPPEGGSASPEEAHGITQPWNDCYWCPPGTRWGPHTSYCSKNTKCSQRLEKVVWILSCETRCYWERDKTRGEKIYFSLGKTWKIKNFTWMP